MFRSGNEALIREARAWVAECVWREDPEDIAELSDEEILRGVDKHYGGGRVQLSRDALLDD
jgi:hypothetical protein